MDPDYRSALTDSPRSWFDDEQLRVHTEVNRVWPRMLGTTPMGIARALTTRTEVRGVRYRWRPFRGRRDRLTDVLHYVKAGWPVAMLVGRFIPRHWVLIVGVSGQTLQCYEPSSGEVRPADVDAVAALAADGAGLSAAVRVRAAFVEVGHPVGDELIARRRRTPAARR